MRSLLALQVQAMFEASTVQRWHTLPHLTDASLARHQWGVAVLCLALCSSPSINLVFACLAHDVPERWGGDTPYPARASVPELQQGEAKIEDMVWGKLGMMNPIKELNEEELWWLKFCDMADLFLWTKHEYSLGNQHVRDANSKSWETLQSMVENCPFEGGVTALTTLSEVSAKRMSDYVQEIC